LVQLHILGNIFQSNNKIIFWSLFRILFNWYNELTNCWIQFKWRIFRDLTFLFCPLNDIICDANIVNSYCGNSLALFGRWKIKKFYRRVVRELENRRQIWIILPFDISSKKILLPFSKCIYIWSQERWTSIGIVAFNKFVKYDLCLFGLSSSKQNIKQDWACEWIFGLTGNCYRLSFQRLCAKPGHLIPIWMVFNCCCIFNIVLQPLFCWQANAHQGQEHFH
jgi:hypothetical protein